MTRKEYTKEVRPIIRGILAVIIWCKMNTKDMPITPDQAFPVAELFINEIEGQIKFES